MNGDVMNHPRTRPALPPLIRPALRRGLTAVCAIPLAIGALLVTGPLNPAVASGGGGTTLFIRSAVEHPNGTVTLPLHQGLSHGRPVYYVVLDASDGSVAAMMGVNTSQKLANAANTDAVEKVAINRHGTIAFPATVNFSPSPGFALTPGPTGFPPAAASPPAVGEPGYSPLIQLPDGVVISAPQVANSTGQANKVVSIDVVNKTVTYKETSGFQGGKALRYVSTDSSDPTAAAIERVTYAPRLNDAPTINDDSTASARASLAAFTNGQTGASNANRQGLNSALLDGLDPLNVLRWNPHQGRYSPLWDVHLTQWQVPAANRTVQTDYNTVAGLAQSGAVVGFNGTPQGTTFAASGFIVFCPIVSQSS
jgi:hypothetical protein